MIETLGMRAGRAALALALAASVAACGGKERPGPTPPPPELPMRTDLAEPVAIQPQPGLTPTQRLARVVELLVANDEPTARAELAQLLRDEPNRREALVLRQSIEGDPRAVLPGDRFSYTVRPGDTYITLARDYVGDSYKFYALARINGIAANRLKAGDTIQLPGRFREPRREREERARPAPRPREPGAPPQAAPAAPRTDQAVGRLSQAAQLDPANEAIAADLARARRIQATVRGR